MTNTIKVVPVEPTDEMLNAARDWSVRKYGQGIGIDAATSCWRAMLAAAPTPEQSDAPMNEWGRIGQLISSFADTNHPAMKDWAAVGFYIQSKNTTPEQSEVERLREAALAAAEYLDTLPYRFPTAPIHADRIRAALEQTK